MRSTTAISTAFAAALAICGQGVAATRAEAAPGGKSICVASTLGQRFAVQKIGVMVFGNALEHASIDSWGIDEAAVRRIAQIAGRGYSVRRIPVPKALTTVPSVPFSGWTSNPVQDRMRGIAAASPKCTIYVTLMPVGRSYNGSNQHLSGLGIVDTPGPFDRIFVFASFSVVIYDGDTFEIIKSAMPGDLFPGLMAAPSAVHRQVDRSWFPASPQAAAQSAQLKNATRALVEEGLSKGLTGAFGGGA